MHIVFKVKKQKSLAARQGSFSLQKKYVFSTKVLVLNPYPQTPFPRKGAILLGLPPLDPVGGYAPATPFLSTIEVFRQSESLAARQGSFQFVEKVCIYKNRLFLQSATGCENQPVFFALLHFFIDKKCFCSVLYITRAVRNTVSPLRKEHYYEIIRKTH